MSATGPLDEHELRALVRASIARVLGSEGADTPTPPGAPGSGPHASHARYGLPESGGPCLIEPSVPCTHCGYCQSHGH